MSDGQQASNEALQRMLKTGEYSDLTIKCGDRTFQVHKNIVCARSEYFATACKPGAFKEGATGTIELQSSADPDAAKDDPSLDDPDAVKLMIDFLYLHNYVAIETCFSETPKASNKRTLGATDGDAGSIMHAKVYALGSKYQIPSLQSTSLKKFEAAAALAWDSEEFVHAVHLVYTTTPDSDKGLRDIAAHVILEHEKELCDKPAMEAVVRSFDGLAYNLFKSQTKRPKPEGPTCLKCGNVQAKVCLYGCSGSFVCCDCYDTYESRGVYYCQSCVRNGNVQYAHRR